MGTRSLLGSVLEIKTYRREKKRTQYWQREKMSSNTISTKSSTEPTGSSAAQMALQRCLSWDQTNGPFTPHISQSLGEATLGRVVMLGEAALCSQRNPRRKLTTKGSIYKTPSSWEHPKQNIRI